MMIFVTGDTHGSFQRFGTKYFPERQAMGRHDCIIVAGDFGGVMTGTPSEEHWLNWLEDQPFTTLFVDGNHENFDRLNSMPIHRWHGGSVHFVRSHVIHLMRGQVFVIHGLTIFVMGGAATHDIQDGILDPASPDFEQEYWFKRRTRQMFRVKGVSWWPEEMPSDAEYEEALKNLNRVNWQVDFVLTHCAPSSVQKKLDRDFTPDRLTDFLETVKERCNFTYWLLGHYHRNCVTDGRFIILWEQMVKLETGQQQGGPLPLRIKFPEHFPRV